MKKLIFATAALCVAATISAQEVTEAQTQTTEQAPATTAKTFKPGSERFGAEAGFNFGNGFSLSGGTLNCNYTLSDELMIRLGFGLNVDKEVKEVEGKNEKTSNTTTTFDLKPGLIYSFTGTDRLEPYVGGEVVFGIVSNNDKESDPNVKTTQTHFGLNAVSGFNVYVCKDLYVGAEVGFGFLVTPGAHTKVDDSNSTETDDPGHTTHIGANVNPAVRVGWKF